MVLYLFSLFLMKISITYKKKNLFSDKIVINDFQCCVIKYINLTFEFQEIFCVVKNFSVISLLV